MVLLTTLITSVSIGTFITAANRASSAFVQEVEQPQIKSNERCFCRVASAFARFSGRMHDGEDKAVLSDKRTSFTGVNFTLSKHADSLREASHNQSETYA